MKNKKIIFGIIGLILVVVAAIIIIKVCKTPSNEAKSFISKPEASGGIEDYDSMSIKELLDADESLTFLFTGDSITHNTVYTQGMNGYVEWFEQYLYDIGRNKDAVINSSWSGADIGDLQIMENTLSNQGCYQDPGMGIENFITKYNPDVVFIKISMNDREKPTEDFINEYKSMLTNMYKISLQNNKIPKVVVISSTPVSGENYEIDQANPTSDEPDKTSTLRLRNALANIVTEGNAGGYNIEFVDFRSAFLDEALVVGDDYLDLFFSDPSDGRIHPNATGQYLMFKSLCKSLELYDEKMDIFQVPYSDIAKAALFKGESVQTYFETSGTSWEKLFEDDSIWIIAGAEQMSGYEGPVVNRSIVRLIENAVRRTTGIDAYRDIRMVNAAAPGKTPDYLNDNFEELIGRHEKEDANTVFMLLPEIPSVYSDGYDHTTQLANYQKAVEELIKKSTSDVKVLWTPLASNQPTINAYLADYAQVVRDIADANKVLLFDAYKIMNEVMEVESSVTRNWFENNGFISPLGAVDISYAFVTELNVRKVSADELWEHNLRDGSDNRAIKGNYVRDYYEASVSVDGTTVTLDVSTIVDAYGINGEELKLVLLPAVGTGNYHPNIQDLKEVTTVLYENNKFSFETQDKDMHIAIYATIGEQIYRFKDVAITVDTTNE